MQYEYINQITGVVHFTLKEAMQDILEDIANGYIKPEEIPDGEIKNILKKETLSPRKNVAEVCRFLYLHTGKAILLAIPKYVDPIKDGYSCKWMDQYYFTDCFDSREQAEEVVKVVNKALHIHCYITPRGRLVIPRAVF